tara:strand:- start:4386 stop:5492 length:1107 start_codon:yes stop_codon:yes gene_type:complete
LKISFVDLKSQYISIKKEIDDAIARVITETTFIKGKHVKLFEEKYSNLYKIKHCIGCGNGTDAIYIALKSLGIGRGDEVITVSNTWISTAETITQAGAKPIFVDIDEYHNIDISKIEEKINNRTKALIAVHLYGLPAKIKEISKLCKKYNLKLIEDCAQSHLAEYDGKLVGTYGDIATFSFFPGKNLGAYGDAGAIITNNNDYADFCRKYSNHGSLIKHKHEIEGINSRLDGLQAAILNVKLKYIKEWTQKRIDNAGYYDELFKKNDYVTTPLKYNNAKHVYHLYVIKCTRRDELKTYLEDNGISVAIHYPKPLPFLKAYKYLDLSEEDFSLSKQYQSEILSLPMYPELTIEQMDYIYKNVCKFYELS